MARILASGAEEGDLLWFEIVGATYIDSSNKYTGSYSYGVRQYGGFPRKYLPEPLDEFYIKFVTKSNKNPWDHYEPDIINWHDGGQTVGSLYYNGSTRLLQAKVGGTVVATGTTTFLTGQWNVLEIYLKIATSGSFRVKLNGTMEIEWGGDTTASGTYSEVEWLQWCVDYSIGYNPTQWIDDIALNDTSGPVNNSWVGPVRMVLLKPNSEGDVLEWTPSSGSHFQCVDEIPPNSADYVWTKEYPKQDMFNVQNFDGTNKAINNVWATARMEDASDGSSEAKIGINSSGSIPLSESYILQPYYRAYWGLFHAVDPATGEAWDAESVNGLQLVVESET